MPKIVLRFVKFLFVGGFGASCYVAGSYILTTAGMRAWIASFIVYASLIPVMYLLQKRFVFGSAGPHSKSFPRYLIIQLIGLILSVALPFSFNMFNISPTIAFVCVVFFVTLTNYALQSRWAFSKKQIKGALT